MVHHVDLRDFRFFRALAEELHFGRAAERLRIAQPHLSSRIKELEERLGVVLFERSTRAVKLTAAGEQFLERVRYALTQFDEAVSNTRRFAEGRQGSINVGFIPAAAYRILPSVLREFADCCPRVDVNLTFMPTVTQIRQLVEGHLHFGFLRPPVQTRRLSAVTLAREGVTVALPSTHPLADSSSLTLESLANESFIQYAPAAGLDFQQRIVSYCNRAGSNPRIRLEADHTEAILVFVASGFGVALLPEWVKETSRPRVVFRAVPEIPPLVDLAIAWVAADESPVRRAFLDVVRSYIRGHPID